MRIAIVQYGVLHEHYEALRSGGEETYYAQRYSVDFVAELAKRHEFVGVCGMLGEKAEESRLTDSLHSACTPLRDGAMDAPAIIDLLEKWAPDRLILQAPDRKILKWALKNHIETLPLFADSFEHNSLRHRYRAFRLARLLANPRIRAMGNHNVPSCLSLRRIGVPADKIYPWDWPHELRPENNPVKALGDGPPRLIFVGSLSASKGVGECIKAARILRNEGLEFKMRLIGSGSFSDEGAALIEEYGLSDCVALCGRLSHDAVVEALKGATLSMAPSWHEYPEGLPMTIYEALATRTPLALSDHPMLQLYFRNTPAARMAPEKDAAALANAIKALITDPQAYAEASEATGSLWNRVKCDLTWGKLITAWLGENGADLASIREYGLEQKLAAMKQGLHSQNAERRSGSKGKKLLERIYNKLYLLSEPYLPGSDKTLCYIHIGKCGGETLLSVIKRSEVIQNRFTTIKKAHIIKPIYQRNMRYLIVVRNPVSRALSAFNWRYKLVVEDKIQEDRFDGEIDILKKYKTLNDLAESLYSEGRLNTDVAKEFRLIHHLKEDISFYLTDLLKKVKAQQIFAVLTQEYLNDDIRNFLGVINNESIHTNRSKMDENRLYLSERALENLKCFLKPDYDALKKLNALYPLEENRLQKLLH